MARGLRLTALSQLLLSLAPLALSGTGGEPRLAEFRVIGLLPSGKQLLVPFDPPFEDAGVEVKDYICKVDHAMEFYKLVVKPEVPAVMSELLQDGQPVLSRGNLTHARLERGAQTVFTVSVTDGGTSRFTLVVQRRVGTSLELLGLRPLTAEGDRFTVPYREGELQEKFSANQSFYEDFFVVEYDFADGGQDVQCRTDAEETIGGNVPRPGQMGVHPHTYIPALEELNHVSVEKVYNLHSPGAGPTARCSVPIDTWRRITVGIHIRAADKVTRRTIRLVITRNGCAQGQFYHQGACVKHCPTYFYTQEFNWRCGKCNEHCEFCEHWHHCKKCRRNTTMYRYHLQDNGTCSQGRTHPYRVYYDAARYLALACTGLIALFAAVATCYLCRRACSRERRKGGVDRGGESEDIEERVPLTGGRDMPLRGTRGYLTVGAGGLRAAE